MNCSSMNAAYYIYEFKYITIFSWDKCKRISGLLWHETEPNHQKRTQKRLYIMQRLQWEKHYTEDHGVNKCFIYLCHVIHDLITRTRYWWKHNCVVKREKICVCSYVEEVKPATLHCSIRYLRNKFIGFNKILFLFSAILNKKWEKLEHYID